MPKINLYYELYKQLKLKERRSKDPDVLIRYEEDPQTELKRIRWVIDSKLYIKTNFIHYPEVEIKKFDIRPASYLLLSGLSLYAISNNTSILISFLLFSLAYIIIKSRSYYDEKENKLYEGLNTMNAIRDFAFKHYIQNFNSKKINSNQELLRVLYSYVVPENCEIPKLWIPPFE
jgi:hypothetical protein